MTDPLKIPRVGPGPPPIEAMRPAQAPARPQPMGAEKASFKDVLTEAMTEVQRLQNEADTTIKQLVAGEIKDVSEAMVAVQKADVSFQTMMTVRGKVMTAYEEIMRMQI